MIDTFFGWEAHILANDLIRVVMVPALGGRVMAFDLGDHAGLWVNPALHGTIADPDPEAAWPNFGGYKTWPAPQDRWDWPPPPLLDHGAYALTTSEGEAGARSAHLGGPVERWLVPGLRFDRTLTITPHSARVRVEQRLTNTSPRPQRWSIWDITQHPVESAPGAADYDHFHVYFPINPRSQHGWRGAAVSAESAAWRGKSAPGIFEVVFRPEDKKLFADPAEGWIAYTDETPRGDRSGVAYAKLFGIIPSAEYPDGGARIEVWINKQPVYLEVEVMGPMADLDAGGGQTTLIETWGACRYGGGAIVRASQAGVVAERLSYDAGRGHLTGRGGVFEAGHAQIVWLDLDSEVIATGERWPVTPLETLRVDVAAAAPPGAVAVELCVVAADGEIAGVWDGVTLHGQKAFMPRAARQS